MGLLNRLLSALGLGSSGSRPEPDAESEAAVKEPREPPASATDASADTGSVTEEPPSGKPAEDDEVESAAEPAEAAGPGSQVEEPEPVDGATDETALDEGAEQAAADQDEADEAAIDAAERQADAEAGADAEAAAEEPAAGDRTDAGDEPADVGEGSVPDTDRTDAADLEPEAPADGGEPLESVNGIGPAYANRLNEAGLASVADLADADAAAVSERTDISEKRIQRWIDRAKDR